MAELQAFKRADLGVIGFGKFQGRKWSEVPDDYLRFLVSSKCYTNRDNKWMARTELFQRRVAEGQLSLFRVSPLS